MGSLFTGRTPSIESGDAAKMAALEGARDHEIDLFHTERFDHVIDRPHFHRLDGRFDRGVAGDHHHGHLGTQCGDLLQDLETIDTRENEIENHQVERRRPHAESLQYVRELQEFLDGQLARLDGLIDEKLETRSPERVGQVERAILQIGIVELCAHVDGLIISGNWFTGCDDRTDT